VYTTLTPRIVCPCRDVAFPREQTYVVACVACEDDVARRLVGCRGTDKEVDVAWQMARRVQDVDRAVAEEVDGCFEGS